MTLLRAACSFAQLGAPETIDHDALDVRLHCGYSTGMGKRLSKSERAKIVEAVASSARQNAFDTVPGSYGNMGAEWDEAFRGTVESILDSLQSPGEYETYCAPRVLTTSEVLAIRAEVLA